jgi:hypothetical protein
MEQARRFPEEPFIIGPFGKVLFLDAVRAAEVCSNGYMETSGPLDHAPRIAVDPIKVEKRCRKTVAQPSRKA